MTSFSGSVVQEAALAWLGALGYAVLRGPEIASGGLLVKDTECTMEVVG